MGLPVQIQLSDENLAMLDRMVGDGVAKNRSDVIRLALATLDDSVLQARIGETIANSYRLLHQSREDDALAMDNAISTTEAKLW